MTVANRTGRRVLNFGVLPLCALALWARPAAAELAGAGATFPYPIHAKWAEAFRAKTGIAVSYQSIGSGGGIKRIESRTIDLGASDMPLKPAELEKSGLVQFPMVMGGVVPVVNLAGAAPGQLKLDGKVLADIYLGNIAKWNDPAVARLNPDLKLPRQAIAVIHRSDGLAKQAVQFFDWAYRSGTAMAEALDYVPMPDAVVGLVQESWKAIRTPNGAPIWTGPPS
jgi:phosphate transport system substrate-binding protein